MGKFKLDKNGIKKIQTMLKNQTAKVEKQLAVAAYDYFLNFAYHVKGAGPKNGGGGYSLYYLANWNCCLNAIDNSVISPPRPVRDATAGQYGNSIARKKAAVATQSAVCGDSISVTNSVYYGPWLNNGGTLDETHQVESEPNRFIELCVDHVENSVEKIVKQVKKECPGI